MTVGTIALTGSLVWILKHFVNRRSNVSTGFDVGDDVVSVNSKNEHSKKTEMHQKKSDPVRMVTINEYNHAGANDIDAHDEIAGVAEQKLNESISSSDSTSSDTSDREYLNAEWFNTMTVGKGNKFENGLKQYMIDLGINTIEKLFGWKPDANSRSVIEIGTKNGETYLHFHVGIGVKKYSNIQLNLGSEQDSFS